MTGSITKRGNAWRVRSGPGPRWQAQPSVHGTKKQAAAELTRLLAARDTSASVGPDKITIADYL
jgi:hypothetical protein